MIIFTKLFFLLIQILPLCQAFISAKEIYGDIMLNTLVFDGGIDRRNKEVQTLTAEPCRTVLV